MAYEALYTRGRPKNLSQLVGQEHISNALTRAVISRRLSHAYLLVGTRGTGKTSTARLLAKAMNCEKVLAGTIAAAEEIPCNECASCRSIDFSPDNLEFDAASNRSVDDVTRLLSSAYLAPVQSPVKTFIIDEIHMLSNEAINSILKLIEEPPPNVAFFLATTEINKVPMTIRSRCQVLNFKLIPQEKILSHLLTTAGKLGVELQEDAAKKIARLAEGSMRDALTYLDQCYAMADEKITLEDVNETLGLVSDADLDEIISAVQSQSRAAVGRAINHAFSSGLSSVSIAEALITRLRDIEFENLRGDISDLDNFVDAVRKAILEMQGSGVPDIILEMTLMNLAAPKIISAPVTIAPPSEIPKPAPLEIPKVEIAAPVVANKNNIIDEYREFDEFSAVIVSKGVIKEFSEQVIKLAFPSDLAEKKFIKEQSKFAGWLEKKLGHPIEIETAVESAGENTQNKEFLGNAGTVFEAKSITQIK